MLSTFQKIRRLGSLCLLLNLFWAGSPVLAVEKEVTATAVPSRPGTPKVPPIQVPDNMAQRVLACTGCHGKEGRATNAGFFPRIAGKPAGYLFNQLVNFRDGRRNNPAMRELLEHLGDAYLKEIAVHFAGLELPYPPPQTLDAAASELEKAEHLIRKGDARRDIPACVQCHGEAMTGTLPAVPGLVGLPRDYLIGQLGGWQSGLRRASEPDCMASIARRLSTADITAITNWLSAQTVPLAARAAAPLGAEALAALPLKCGSGTH